MLTFIEDTRTKLCELMLAHSRKFIALNANGRVRSNGDRTKEEKNDSAK